MNRLKYNVVAIVLMMSCVGVEAAEPQLDAHGKNPLVRRIAIVTAEGGRVSWSPDGDLIAFDRKGQDGYFDVWTMKPDGSEQKSVTGRNAMLSTGNVGNPEWHPSGKYLVIQAQDTKLPLPRRGEKLQRYATSPGIGLNNNLWIITATGDNAWQVTSVKSGRGALHPQFSHRGNKLLWSDIAGVGQGAQTMKLADFAIVDGQPKITNPVTLDVGGFTFYETHGFSPDDKSILFSAYPQGGYFYDMEIYSLDLDSRKLTRLTNNKEWDEHAHFSPDGTKIIYSSGEGVPQTKATDNRELVQNPVRLELWIMNADGSGKQRLTYINDPQAPEYVASPIGAGIGDGSWSPDGEKFVAKLRPGRGTEMIALIEFNLAAANSSEKTMPPGQRRISDNLRILGEGAFPHQSAVTGLITFTKKVDEQYEVFTMKPDGSEARCLTKDKAGLRECGNRGQSFWHPSGKYIVFHAENRNLKRIGFGASARPGWGRNFNVWVMTADGEKFWRLTDYTDNWAVMETKFSHDGSRITWNEEYSMEKYPNGKPGDKLMPWSKPSGPPNGHPGAYHTREQFEYRKGEEMLCWRIVYADITFGNDGPKIANIRKLNPPDDFTLNEANGFTPDDKGFIGCYSDLKANRGLARWGELYTCDLDGKLIRRLTDTVWKHNEDPCYSPDGKQIAYKETKGTPGQGDEIFIADADGKNRKQITHFCDKGYPEYDPKSEEDATRKVWGSAGTRITEMCFSPDGKQIVFGRCQAKTHKLGEAEAGNLDTLKTLTDVPSFIYVLDLPK